MRRNVLMRLGIFAVLGIAALLYLMPTFVPNLPAWWTGTFPAERINLGLDLQGGTHLVLEVRVEKAVENRMERAREELRNLLREKGVAVEAERTKENQIRLRVATGNAEQARDLLRSEFPNLTVVDSRTAEGTAELQIALSKEELRSIREDTVDQSLETIRNRIDQFGVSEPIIQRQGMHDILIQLPGIQDPDRAKQIIGKTAVLEFKLVVETYGVEDALRSGPPPGTQILYGPGPGMDRIPYLLEQRTLMTGEHIVDARVRPGDQFGNPYVELILDGRGARIFERITAENVKRRLAIVLDDRVYSAPVIQERIAGGRASITGSFDIREARDLAIVLRAGALPAPVEIVEERTVGPSLGRDSIRQGAISFIVGSSLVLLFMIAYYKNAGLVANVALIFNILFMLAVLAGFQAVLTLPGIAGIVLTMGMAVDANVLINERIREELRAGKSPKSAVETGYERALPAILDSNITTFLSGLILFQFGTGPVKGFAVTLCVGILTTIVTAVYLTRVYYDYRIASRKYARISI